MIAHPLHLLTNTVQEVNRTYYEDFAGSNRAILARQFDEGIISGVHPNAFEVAYDPHASFKVFKEFSLKLKADITVFEPPFDRTAEVKIIPNETDVQRFIELSEQWRKETRLLSNSFDKCTRFVYQQIIGMGEVAVPLMLNDFREERYLDWFWALRAITRQDPVSDDNRGRVKLMAKEWIEWGTRNGYLKDLSI